MWVGGGGARLGDDLGWWRVGKSSKRMCLHESLSNTPTWDVFHCLQLCYSTLLCRESHPTVSVCHIRHPSRLSRLSRPSRPSRPSATRGILYHAQHIERVYCGGVRWSRSRSAVLSYSARCFPSSKASPASLSGLQFAKKRPPTDSPLSALL